MSSRRGITTLKDVFPEIKKEYKRNFLRENKIKIKNIQKDVKTKQQIEKEKQEEIERKKYKLQERLARVTGRTSNHRSESGGSSVRRSKSSHSGFSKLNKCVCGFNSQSPPVSAKSTTSIDKEIQTDFDLDDNYRISKFSKSSQDMNLPLETVVDEEQNEVERNAQDIPDYSHDRVIRNQNQNMESPAEPPYHCREMSLQDQRRESVANPFLCHETVDYMKPHHEVPKSAEITQKFDKLKLSDDCSVVEGDVNKKKSARSIASSNYSRTEIKLPKYLEREKREKELQRLRDLERDPDCPDGFIVLDEKTRLENLEVLQRGFRSLVDELNRMPMSSVTLRVKNRKNEIEKDLVDLENKIRFYQKSKIYVKCPEPNELH